MPKLETFIVISPPHFFSAPNQNKKYSFSVRSLRSRTMQKKNEQGPLGCFSTFASVKNLVARTTDSNSRKPVSQPHSRPHPEKPALTSVPIDRSKV